MASGDRLTLEEVLAAFDEHLRHTRGVCRDAAQTLPGSSGRSCRRFAGGPAEVGGARGWLHRYAGPTCYNAASSTFIVLRRQLGWTSAGRTRAPRVHDLRHRMMVRRIQAWHAQGADVDHKIAALATYLGHVEVRDVYWYYSDSRVIPMSAALSAWWSCGLG